MEERKKASQNTSASVSSINNVVTDSEFNEQRRHAHDLVLPPFLLLRTNAPSYQRSCGRACYQKGTACVSTQCHVLASFTEEGAVMLVRKY